MKKAFPILLVLLALLLASCAHTSSRFTEAYFFQSFGEDGEFLMTADLDRVREGELGTLLPDDNAVIDRTERVTLSLLPKDETIHPSTMENFVLSGSLEGDFPKFLSNVALSFSGDFQKVKGEKPRRFSGSDLLVGIPQSGLVLFTNGDYDDLLSKTVTKREKLIPDDIASKMADASVAFYSRNPETLMDIGFELPQLTLKAIEETYLMFKETSDGFQLDGVLMMESASNARSICTLLKNQYIQSLKKNGEKLDTKKAAGYFTYDEDRVSIDAFVLTESMSRSVMTLFEKTLGGIV